MGLGGFIIGGIMSGASGSAIGLIWGGSIGYGFGSIFGQARPTKWVVAYWAATLGLVGPFFGLFVGAAMNPYETVVQQTVAGAIGAAVGALCGSLIGTIQLWRLRRKPQMPHSDPIA